MLKHFPCGTRTEEATTQTKGIHNHILLEHEEKLILAAMPAFWFLYVRLWMAQLVPGSSQGAV